MAYTVTSDTLGLALGTCLDFATDVHEAITKARQMFDIGFVNISNQKMKPDEELRDLNYWRV